MNMTPEDFEKLVAEEIDLIPEEWTGKIKNVAFLTEDESPKGEPELLGLYQGIPATERGDSYGMVLPDTITLYRLPILQAAEEEGVNPRIIVRETLWHEIAHHFGFDEDAVQVREDERSNRFR